LGFLVPGGKRRDKQPLVEATWELVSCLGHSSYLVTAGNFWILQSKEVKPWEALEDRPSPEVQWSGLWGELLSCTDRHRVLAIRSLSKTSLLRLTGHVWDGESKKAISGVGVAVVDCGVGCVLLV
jgi:hypothetical protein